MNTSRWFATDWSKVFALTTPILEIVVRGSLSYLILFFMMRIVLKCEAGTIWYLRSALSRQQPRFNRSRFQAT